MKNLLFLLLGCLVAGCATVSEKIPAINLRPLYETQIKDLETNLLSRTADAHTRRDYYMRFKAFPNETKNRSGIKILDQHRDYPWLRYYYFRLGATEAAQLEYEAEVIQSSRANIKWSILWGAITSAALVLTAVEIKDGQSRSHSFANIDEGAGQDAGNSGLGSGVYEVVGGGLIGLGLGPICWELSHPNVNSAAQTKELEAAESFNSYLKLKLAL